MVERWPGSGLTGGGKSRQVSIKPQFETLTSNDVSVISAAAYNTKNASTMY
jgi:hypothetical protein